jgi:ADP-ribose pyrophosphatase
VEERMTIYRASDLKEGAASPMEDEKIEMEWFTRKQIADMIAKGTIQDAKTMLGFLMKA